MAIESELYQAVEKSKRYDELLEFQGSLNQLHCSFCGKPQSQVEKLVAGRNVYICDKCVTVCNKILEKDLEKE